MYSTCAFYDPDIASQLEKYNNRIYPDIFERVTWSHLIGCPIIYTSENLYQ
jgi:hypothetical protein